VKRAVGLIMMGILALGCASAAQAQETTYRWTDAAGTIHFTDDESQLRASGAGDRAYVASQAPLEGRTKVAPATSAATHAGFDAPVRIPFERDGQLIRLRVRLNHRIELPFYLDTGSSGIVLPRAAAERLSLPLGADAPRVLLHTTAGAIQVPTVSLDSVQIGGAELENLEASVSPNLEIGLLGGSFFNQFAVSIDPVAQVIELRRISSPR
jgi:clan AA aspartic protease (TIGR02281 family)